MPIVKLMHVREDTNIKIETMFDALLDEGYFNHRFFLLSHLSDAIAESHGIIVPYLQLSHIFVKSLEKRNLHVLQLPSTTRRHDVIKTSNSMIPIGFVGIFSNHPLGHRLFFNSVSDIVMFRLSLTESQYD